MELSQSNNSNNLNTESNFIKYFKKRNVSDWIFAVAIILGSIYSVNLYGSYMDSYEKGILFLTTPCMIAFGWSWRSMQKLMASVAVFSLFAINLYQGNLMYAEQKFFLKFLFSSQSAIMWMSALFVLATLSYTFGLFTKSKFVNKISSYMTWFATAMGFIGLCVRWYESYLIAPDVGHIPVSNLYEVFILFAIITALLYLFYEQRYNNQQLGAFALFIISASVGFLLWYTFAKEAHTIQPLVPALQSYWMKIHVPANFVGYGAFALASMFGVAYLIKNKGYLNSYLPELMILDEMMYRLVAIGFAFFTIATVLGAMWAAEAWGSYWSWDPKETWAFIVWLNYATWLHLRLMKGLRGAVLAWWAIIGLFVTAFAFLGVNMFLSGLHSYGKL